MPNDLLIVGAGPVGMALALALRDAGLDIALIDARERGAARRDPRVLALAEGSRQTLQRLGVWRHIDSTPIRSIHVSQSGGFGRTRIEAEDHRVQALGHVVRAGDLATALDDGLAAAGIPVMEGRRVTRITPDEEGVIVGLDGAADCGVRARLVACAEGGVGEHEDGVSSRDYGQHALVTLAMPCAPHGGLAYERFTPHGPLALLPYGVRYAIVHSAAPAEADRLQALDDEGYMAELERRMGGRVRLAAVEQRLRFPLGLRYRSDPVGARCVWLGNAAQTLHPVAGQGFNLALRDVWALATTLRGALPDGDIGAPAVLARYRRTRRLDRRATIGITDALVRLFSNDSALLRPLRGSGLLALDACPPLRGALARRMMFGARAWP